MRLHLGLLLAACSPVSTVDEPLDTDSPPDTDVVDTDDTDDTDLTVDSAADSAEPVDTDTDAAPVDTGDTDCDLFAFEEVLVLCDGVHTVVNHVGDPLTPGCPSVWDAGTATGADLGDVLDAVSCDRSCVWRLNLAVMVLYCDARGEYLTWEPGGPAQVGPGDACVTQIEVHTVAGSGWTTDWEQWQSENPCP